ncbi:dicer-like 4 [Actinidia rufa]|uniref:Dicer-like 4 n=1 Tax=Actinidia rufa TaxID=165716 RepID=A0A7J0DU19_9ERIC|nr:dicer-like 4 [Actinidia rufa]
MDGGNGLALTIAEKISTLSLNGDEEKKAENDPRKIARNNSSSRARASTAIGLSLYSKLGGFLRWSSVNPQQSVRIPMAIRGGGVAEGPFGQWPGRLLPDGKEDSKDSTIRRLQAQMAEMQQVLVTNNLIKPTPTDSEGSFEALGDLVESFVGAIFLDTGFDLNRVWKMVLSFMDPVISFSKLQLNPVRGLQELCQFYSWKAESPLSKKDGMFNVEAKVTGANVCATACAANSNGKGATRMSAQEIIGTLKWSPKPTIATWVLVIPYRFIDNRQTARSKCSNFGRHFGRPNFNFGRSCTEIPKTNSFYLLKDLGTSVEGL